MGFSSGELKFVSLPLSLSHGLGKLIRPIKTKVKIDQGKEYPNKGDQIKTNIKIDQGRESWEGVPFGSE
jgi:hypothetical protein